MHTIIILVTINVIILIALFVIGCHMMARKDKYEDYFFR